MATCTIIFDTETTSLDPKSNRIVSIAASCGDREFYTLVNPRCPIPRASTKVHGITNAEARLAPAWAVAGIRFWRWVEQVSGRQEEVTFVGHNAARFDWPLLVRETQRMEVRPDWLPPKVVLIDTLKVCRAVLRLMKSHRQALVYKELFGKEPGGQHDALGDVRALRRIMSHPPLARRAREMVVDVTPEGWVVQPDVQRQGAEPKCSVCQVVYSKYFLHRCVANLRLS